ncbi:hypothetical protein niasHT_025379 [Heterodera trifolii]|uniref:Small ubiquitin-related modifier n=1 Tax=Heterodera trifolii TaxID=157864 RepID=A0ABD2JJ54_9BILA
MADKSATNAGGAGAAGGAQPAEYIKLKVVDQDSNVEHFRVKYGTSMDKLMNAYAERTGVQVTSLHFLFDGRRIKDDHTPRSLEMEGDEIIEVYKGQIGGSIMDD